MKMATLAALLTHGVVGTYTHFEATEAFATRKGQRQAINVFTILVAEERLGSVSADATYLNPERIALSSLTGWTFGIRRYVRLIADLATAIGGMEQSGEWRASGESLRVGKLHAVSGQFVPPDSSLPVPWNRVLKNNFWNGSHVLEWADCKKEALQPFFEDPRRLQELSQRVSEIVPIGLAGLSDRLGNLVIQFPVTVVMSKFQKLRPSGDYVVNVAWRPTVAVRDLRASCEMEFDGAVDSYAAGPVQAPQTTLPGEPSFGELRGCIWDEQSQVVLAATGPTGFLNSTVFNLVPLDPEPRTWAIREEDGTRREYRTGVISTVKSVVGEKRSDDNGGYTRKRLYKEQLDRLIAERTFLQYKPAAGDQNSEREKALGDLRALINRHGDQGAWLWDPYLSADDVLATLFYCHHSGSDLRALTWAREPPAPTGGCARIERWFNRFRHGPKPDFVDRQRKKLESVESNWRGLRLEYRVRRGPAGFGFHDRFLIFPKADEAALAWSLGTSVNSLGTEHHILQKVDDGQLVADAFVDLWEQLSKPEHLLWKKP
jgi:hypothetical protein